MNTDNSECSRPVGVQGVDGVKVGGNRDICHTLNTKDTFLKKQFNGSSMYKRLCLVLLTVLIIPTAWKVGKWCYFYFIREKLRRRC